MKTIDEVIKHVREVADFCKSEISTFQNPEPYESYCNGELKKCAEEHEQLAEWLEELVAMRNLDKSNFSDGYEKGRAEAFEEAIEYFEEHAKEVYNHISVRDFICDRLEMLKEQK